jgi:uncharacterized protein (DUF983 family)
VLSDDVVSCGYRGPCPECKKWVDEWIELDESTGAPVNKPQTPISKPTAKGSTAAPEPAGASKKAKTAGEAPAVFMVILSFVMFFFIGLILSFLGHLVFPWMIGNLEHSIRTRSFVWNAQQAAEDSSFVVKMMMWVMVRSSISVGLWSGFVVGLPVGILGSLGAFDEPKSTK